MVGGGSVATHIAIARPRIGVALSGGTLKAAAHAGALDALRAVGIRPDMVAGTSAGAIVAALYAYGFRRSDYLKLIRHFPGASLLDFGLLPWSIRLSRWFHGARLRRKLSDWPSLLPSGLIRGKSLERYFSKIFDGRNPQIPFFILATDLVGGGPVAFSNYAPAIRSRRALPVENIERCLLASCAVPGILRPVKIEDRVLVDGAIRHYVPVYILREMGCEKIIVINLHTLEANWQPRHLVDVLIRSFDVLLRETIDDDIDGQNVFVIEPDVQGTTWVSVDRLENCFEAGYAEVKAQRLQLLAWIQTPPVHSPRIRIGSTAFDSIRME